MDLIQGTSHTTHSLKLRIVKVFSRLLAMKAAYRHRAELLALTPEERADFSMNDREYAAALDMPVTDYPVFATACHKWEHRLLRLSSGARPMKWLHRS